MTAHDIPAGMRLKEAAGWNQTEQDWANVLALEPEGCWVYEVEGHVAGSTTATCYGRELAWIGMVLVDPEYRRRGIARALMEHALEFLARREVEWIKLDATEMGRPLYSRLGFEDERPIERWARDPGPPQPSLLPLQPAQAASIEELDRQAFGADRSQVLGLLHDAYPGEFWQCKGSGYAAGRPGAHATLFGPAVAADEETARCLLAGFLSRHAAERVFWDILPDHAAACALAHEFDFRPLRRLVRMARPGANPTAPRPDGDLSLIWATAGFEYG